jgi:CheY-like chemotaxis protein
MNALDKPVVLVIDPDPLTLTAIAAMLDSAQFHVYCARDREAALKGGARLNLDLIICDESIDDSRGEELIAELRRLPDRDDVPIMYMSQKQLPDIISRNSAVGAAYHIRKPLEPAHLMDTINKALFELPLINNQIRHKLKKPHYPVAPPATASFSIPHLATQSSPSLK